LSSFENNFFGYKECAQSLILRNGKSATQITILKNQMLFVAGNPWPPVPSVGAVGG
jgi:hypothetical protein